jgi:ribonuclease E
MPIMLINATQAEELRVALVNDNKLLYDYMTQRPGFEEKIGNIYLGEISSIEPSLDAVFVNYGAKRHGFLPLKEIIRECFLTNDPEKLERPNIKELLKVGQKILVQVEKEERGNKGAALTTYISLAGSYLVLMPNNPRAGGISRRIEGEDRNELRETLSKLEIPAGMGLIVRTAGVGRSLEELQWDLNVLLNYWEAIKKASQNHAPPLLIHQESDVVIRSIRDYLRADIKEIVIDYLPIFERAKRYIEQVRPDYTARLKLYEDAIPLFILHEIEHQIELAHQRTVRLWSGGSLVIDHTEALVSIDVNSARATKGGDIEETALNTNLEAAEAIARQVRLRDIGGIIVIDFIDMVRPEHKKQVENHLYNHLKDDRARIQIGRISRFGLLEMSRQRLRPSLQEATQEVCPRCNGQGSIRSVESLALSIIRIIEEDSIKENTAQIQLQLSNEAATYLLNEKRGIISNIEQRQKVSILIIPNPNIQYPHYRIKRLRKTDIIEQANKLQTSYRMIESAEVESPIKQVISGKTPAQPVVKDLLPTMPPAPMPKKPMQGLIKRLWASMFGGSAPIKEKEMSEGSSGDDISGKFGAKQVAHKRPRPRKPHHKPHRKPHKGVYQHSKHTVADQQQTPKPQKVADKTLEPTPSKEKRENPNKPPSKKEHPKRHSHEEAHKEERSYKDEKPPKSGHKKPVTNEVTKTEQETYQKATAPLESKEGERKEQTPIIIRPTTKREVNEQENAENETQK